MQRIIIVPVEPPPLTITPAFIEALSDSPVNIIGGHPVADAGILLISGVVALVKLPKASKSKTNLEEAINKWYSSDQTWIPTRVLAFEAASQIASASPYEVVVSEKMYTPPSLKKREITLLMENWYRPLRGWYNQSFSALDPEKCKEQNVDAVLEVGIINYEIDAQGRFLFQVLIKLSNAAAGQVEGKARSFTYLKIGPPHEMFQNNAEEFKKFVEEEGSRLLIENLIKIGLLPPNS
jgi:hypothetical protein